MKEFYLGAVVAMFVIFALSVINDNKATRYDAAIEECEKELPRDKKCKVIGVIDEDLK